MEEIPVAASANVTSPAEVLTPNELVWKHIKNPEHIITDEELRKVLVGLALEESIKHHVN